MLSIGKMSMGQDGYYATLAREDYYLKGGEPPGQWLGSGAEALRLSGQVDNERFKELFSGRFKGMDLVQNAGSEKRCPGWDCTFSAPKSVSVAWSQAEGTTAQEFRAAHLSAVEAAVSYLEDRCGWTRRGHAGEEMEKARLVFAAYEHGTSRAQDPQLHTHALLLNICLRTDGTTGALDTRALYSHKMAAGALYRAELSRQLEVRLGLESIEKGSMFELKGVPKALCDEFSKRRKEIEAKLEELGASGAVISAKLAISTRSHKQHDSRENLSAEWKKVGRLFQWSTEKLEALLGRIQPRPEQEVALYSHFCAVKAVEKLTQTRSTFSERDVVRLAADMAQGRGIGADRVTADCAQYLTGSPDIHRLGFIDGEIRYTTKEILELEQDMMRRVGRSRTEGQGTEVNVKALQDALKKHDQLNDEQQAAVRHICQSSGSISVITGDAGTGKTTMLKAAREAMEAAGYTVKGTALSGKAADGLQEGAKIKSQTLASLLWEVAKSNEMFDEGKARQNYKEWCNQHPLRNYPKFDPAKAARSFYENRIKAPLDAQTVLVVDEAGMVDTRQMAKLIEVCEKTGTKLTLVGDSKQLQAIELGGAFKGIAEVLGSKRLRENFRQVDPEAKKAVQNLGEGRAAESLDFYARKGALSVADDREKAKIELIDDWAKTGGLQKPQDYLIMAGKNVDVVALNREAQKKRAEEGLLGKASITLGGEKIHKGDRLLFTQNNKPLAVRNGNMGTVEKLSKILGTLTVRLDNGERRVISTSSYEHLKLGYAVTTYKGQGMTVENSFVLTDDTMQDKENSYVQISRAKLETRIYTTKEEAGPTLAKLAYTMQRSREKEMAVHQVQRAQQHTLILTL